MNSISGFELLETKHASESSIVYKALRICDKKNVILKSINPENYNAEFIGKLKHEYEISHLIEGMEVIKILDIIQEPNQCSLIIEDIEGQSLADLIAQDKLNDLNEILRVAIKIVEGLVKIHQARVIHKDINPSNIIYNRQTGQVKIIDFGISSQLPKENTPLTSPKAIEGTLPYVAPEQSGRMNRSVDYRSDFYSLGATLFELLTHHTPFESDDPIEVIHGHIAKAVPHAIDLNPSVPQSVSDIVVKLLSKSAEDRYQGCWGIKSDLEKCLDLYNQFNSITPFPLAQHDIPDRFHVPQKLYGRHKEVACILASFDRVSQGSREGIFIGGHSGIGKTALVREVYKPLTKQKGYFISGKFEQYQKEKPYSAVSSAFVQLIKQLLSEGETQLSYWKKALDEALGGSVNVITDVIPELKLIMGPQPPLDPLPPNEAQNRFKIAFGRFLQVFCRKAHPLAIFLDDLQWADAASLSILSLLLQNTSIKHLLLIGAYRDNEVSDSAPLNSIINSSSNENIKLQKIQLLRLDLHVITQQLADALYHTTEQVSELSQLVSAKTDGNPFFIEEFLKSLYNDKYIEFSAQQGTWVWDLKEIEDANFSDNVVEFLTERIKLLPQETQQILAMAACVGNRFDISSLSEIHNGSLSATALKLRDATIEGFIIPSDLSLQIGELSDLEISEILRNNIKIEYRFSHDRIQQSAYTFLDSESKNATHEKLAWHFYREDNRELEDRIFEIVDNFNIHFTSSTNNNLLVAKLNCLAAQKSKNSTAYKAAQNYIEISRSLMPENWSTETYPQQLKIYTESVEIAYLNNNIEQMLELAEKVNSNAQNIVDSLPVRLIQIQALNSQNKPNQSIALGLATLRLVGIRIPSKPSKLHVVRELLLLKLSLSTLSHEDLYALPEAKDPSILHVQKIFSTISLPSYLVNKNLSSMLGLRAMRLAIKYGNSGACAYSYMIYAVVLCGILEDFDAGLDFGKLSIRIAEKYNAKTTLPRAVFTNDLLIRHWKEPIANGIESTLDAYNLALESGALEMAATCSLTAILCKFYAGHNLLALSDDLNTSSKIAKELNQGLVLNRIALNRQYIDNLIHRNKRASILRGRFFDEYKAVLGFMKSNDLVSLSSLYSYKLNTAYIYREAEDLLRICSKNEYYLSSSLSQPKVPIYYFLSALSLLYLYPTLTANQRKGIFNKVRYYRKKLNKYRQYCPQTNTHRYYLLQAEFLKVKGNYANAIQLYDKAIHFATKSQNKSEQAISEECAGRFYIDLGSERAGKAYLEAATQSYRQWGAQGKVDALTTEFNLREGHQAIPPPLPTKKIIRHAPLPTDESTTEATINGSDFNASFFDSSSLIKTYRALSSEMDIHTLINKLTQYLMENAGAQSAYLLTLEEENWVIRSHKTIHKAPSFKSSLLSAQSPISTRVVHYVESTGEVLILENAEASPNYGMDPHILKDKVKSICCMPIKYKGKITTLFYAEHNDTEGAFTSDQIKVLNVIASQGAIAMENATLYSTLKHSEDQYRGLFENAVEGLFQASIEGRPILANPALVSMLGYKSFSELTKNVPNLLHDLHVNQEDVQRIRELIRQQGKAIDVEARIVKQDQSVIDALYSITLILDEENNPCRLDGVIKDVTAQKRHAELFVEKERAEAASSAKSQFLANMSHEIRTPMNGVLGIADLLRNTQLNPVQAHYVQVISDSGKSLLEIINDILDFSKIESGKMEIELIPIEIDALLDEVVSLFSIRSSDTKVALIVKLSDATPNLVLGDPTRIRQILMNLIGNAFKFTETGSITVALEPINRPSGETLKFSVIDTGIGIPETAIHRLFHSYEQVDNTTTRKYGGTGLGLSICKRLAELMGGEVGIESAEGEGSTFWFTIPLKQTLPPSLDPLQNQDTGTRSSAPEHIDSASIKDAGYLNVTHARIKSHQLKNDTKVFLYTDNLLLKNALEQTLSQNSNQIRFFNSIESLTDELAELALNGDHQYIILLHNLKQPDSIFEQFKTLAEFYFNLDTIKIVYLSEPSYPVDDSILSEEPFKNAYIAERPLSVRGVLRIFNAITTSSMPDQKTMTLDTTTSTFLLGRKILIAEDNKVNQLVIQRQLEALGAEITVVENGLLALQCYEESLTSNGFAHEIILMDCEMPEMDGYRSTELIREAEQSHDHPPVKIIALTAHALAENEKRCLACGMDAVLTKPVVRKDLETTLQKLISPTVH